LTSYSAWGALTTPIYYVQNFFPRPEGARAPSAPPGYAYGIDE